MRLRNDPQLRKALHGLYLALFNARELSPGDFKPARLTTIHTAIMGVEDFGWRVVGITPEALELLATVNFRKSDLPRCLCRGHIVDRATTAKELFQRQKALTEKRFFEVFIENDRTVIMLAEQNRVKGRFPSYLPIRNDDASLFRNGGLMSWKHRKAEIDFLESLYRDFKRRRIKTTHPETGRG